MLHDLSWDLLLLIASVMSWESLQLFLCVHRRVTTLREDKRLWVLRMMYDFPRQTLPADERHYRFLYELAYHASKSSTYLDGVLYEMIDGEIPCKVQVGVIPHPVMDDNREVPLLSPLTFPLPVKVITLTHEHVNLSYAHVLVCGYRENNGSKFLDSRMSLLGYQASRTGRYRDTFSLVRRGIGLDKAILPYAFLATYPDLFQGIN